MCVTRMHAYMYFVICLKHCTNHFISLYCFNFEYYCNVK